MKKNLCETFCNSEKLTLSFKVGKIVLQWGPPVFLLEGALSGVHCSGSTIDNEAKSVVKERASTRQRSLEGRWIMTRHWREPFQNHNAWPLDLTTHPLWHKVKPCHCGWKEGAEWFVGEWLISLLYVGRLSVHTWNMSEMEIFSGLVLVRLYDDDQVQGLAFIRGGSTQERADTVRWRKQRLLKCQFC